MFHHPSLSWLCAVLISTVAIILFFSLFILLRKNKHPGLPPSPPTIPLVGNLHQLGSLPHCSLRALAQRHGPVMLLHLGSVPTVIVSSAAAAQDVLKIHDLDFATRPNTSLTDRLFYGSRDIVFARYGDYWRQVRRVSVLHLLSPKQVQSFRRVWKEEANLLVHRIRETSGQPTNISVMLVGFVTDIFCRVAFGKKHFTDEESGSGRVHRLLMETMAVLGSFPVRDFLPWLGWIDQLSGLDAKVRKVVTEIDAFIEKVLDEHATTITTNNNDMVDFVDILLSLDSLVEGESLGRDDIKAIILDVFTGGTDTSFTTIEWAMAELIKRPEEMRRVQKELRSAIEPKALEIGEAEFEGMEFFQAVIKETMRLHPPLPLLAREAMKDSSIQGYHIPRGTRLMINAWAIGRDSSSWEKPEEFWPTRFLEEKNRSVDFKGQEFHFLPFGAGRRGCPGTNFGISTVELALANLPYHFDWELPNGMREEEVDMTESAGIVVHKKSSLVLVPKPVGIGLK